MRLQQRRFKITPLLGFGLAAGSLVWLAAGDAFSRPLARGSSRRRWSAPQHAEYRFCRSARPNFRVAPTGPRAIRPMAPETGNPSTGNPDTGKPPKGNPEAGRKPPRGPKGPGIVVIPPEPAVRQPPSKQFCSSASPFRRMSSGVPPAGEIRYEPNQVIIELDGNRSCRQPTALAQPFPADAPDRCICRSPTRRSIAGRSDPRQRSVPSRDPAARRRTRHQIRVGELFTIIAIERQLRQRR